MSITQNLLNISSTLPKSVTLVAVSKTKPIESIQAAYNAGQRVFGENKIQEMVEKHKVLPKDIEWHMIGHLQSNKVKYMASFVTLIHGVDKFSTLKEINKQAKKHNRTINCLLQVKIAEEDTKFGLTTKEVINILNSDTFKLLENINITGLMGMASNTSDKNKVQNEFKFLNDFYNTINKDYNINTLSMGMSGDYPLAIKQGSTMIRVGSAIFGTRNY